MRRRVRGIASVLVVMLAASACKKSNDGEVGAFHPLDVGSAVPEYVALTLSGDTLRVGSGEAPTVINVWATWCTSCREEMAALDSLKTEYGPRGVRVIGVSVDQGRSEKVKQFAETNQLGFAVSHDPAGDIQRLYQVVGVPTTFVVGRDGRLVWRHTGNITGLLDEVRASVRRAESQ